MLIDNTNVDYTLGEITSDVNGNKTITKIMEKNGVASPFISANDTLWKVEEGKRYTRTTRYGGKFVCENRSLDMFFACATTAGDFPAKKVAFKKGLKWDLYICILDNSQSGVLMVASCNTAQSTPTPKSLEKLTIPVNAEMPFKHTFATGQFQGMTFYTTCYIVWYPFTDSLTRDILGTNVSSLSDEIMPLTLDRPEGQLDEAPFYFKVTKYPEEKYTSRIIDMDSDFWVSENTAYIKTGGYRYAYVHYKPSQFIEVGYYSIPYNEDEKINAVKNQVKIYQLSTARRASVYLYEGADPEYLGYGGILLCFNRNVESDYVSGDNVIPELNYTYLNSDNITDNCYCVAGIGDIQFWGEYYAQAPFKVDILPGAPRQLMGGKFWTFWRLKDLTNESWYMRFNIEFAGESILDCYNEKWYADFTEIFDLDEENYIKLDYKVADRTLTGQVVANGVVGDTITLSSEAWFKHTLEEGDSRPEDDPTDPNRRNPIVVPYVNTDYFNYGVFNWYKGIGVAGLMVFTEIPLDQYTYSLNLASKYNWEYIDPSQGEIIPEESNFYDYIKFNDPRDDGTTLIYEFHCNDYASITGRMWVDKCHVYLIPFYVADGTTTADDASKFTQFMDYESTKNMDESKSYIPPHYEINENIPTVGENDDDFEDNNDDEEGQNPDPKDPSIQDGKDNPTLPDGESAKPSTEEGSNSTATDPIEEPSEPIIATSYSGLLSLYMIDIENLRKFVKFLWSDNFWNSAMKAIFGVPTDAIMNISYLFLTANGESTAPITIHNITTDAIALKINNPVQKLDCGYLDVKRTFGSFLDYQCKIEIFLPFIGSKILDTTLVMGSRLYLTYSVDFFSGACMAFLSVEKNGIKSLAYSFNGNCSSQIPLTSEDYVHVFQATISMCASAGAAMLAAPSNPLAPIAATALSVANNLPLNSNIQSSGNVVSNFGALDVKIPYITITRPTPAKAEMYNSIVGVPAEMSTVLGKISGFCVCKSVKIENIAATYAELQSIEMLLKRGVYL